MAGFHGNFFKKLITIFQSCCTILQFCHQCVRVPVPLYLHQHLVSPTSTDLFLNLHLFLILIFKNLFIYLFIFGCVGSLLLRTGFLQLWRVGATLCCGARASHCSGFSCCGVWALGMLASVVVARGLSSCGTQAQLLCGMWDLPGPGIEPVSLALAGRFLTTAPPGKSVPVCL